MEKLFFSVCVLLLATQLVSGQTTDSAKTLSAQAWQDTYLKKYKTNKTAGWILLGSGIGMIVGGGLAYAAYAGQGYNGSAPVTAEALFLIAGPGAALASIPFFISAKRNKAKANLIIKKESASAGNRILFSPNYMAVGLTIQL